MGINLSTRLAETVKQEDLDKNCTGLLLAVSGGPDSMAMLHCYKILHPAYPLFAACADHGLRPGSAQEAELVKDICQQWNIPFYSEILPVRQTLPRGTSLEEHCRTLRYAWLEKQMQLLNCSHLATAHNADDNAETVLLHLLRGTGLSGLRGILPRREIKSGNLIRPLINCGKADMITYCKEQGIPYAEDESNWDLRFERNRIRHKLIPFLKEEFNPAIIQALHRCARAVRQDEDCLDRQAKDLLPQEGPLNAAILRQTHPALRRRVLREWFRINTGISLSSDQTEEADKLFQRPDGQMELFRKYILCITDAQLFLILKEEPLPPTWLESGQPSPDGRLWLEECIQTDPPSSEILTGPGPLLLRTRRPGDRIRTNGREQELKKCMSAHKIPPPLRDHLLVLCREDKILWVEGIGTDPQAIAPAGTRGLRICRKNQRRRLTIHKEAPTMGEKIRTFLSEEEIQARIAEMGRQITKDYQGKNLLLIGILKGSVVFLADLMRQIQLPLAIDFMIISSYGKGTSSSGNVKIIKDLDLNISDYDLLIAEDILDSGYTLSKVIEMFRTRNPRSLRVAALLDKPDRRVAPVELDYRGFTIPDEFVVGCGLDYNQKYRNLPYVGVLEFTKD